MTRPDAKLPAGRRPATGLSKDEVTGIQRTRMLFAMADAVADLGYHEVSVAEVVARAGVSRATFYEQFEDRQDCFLAAFDFAAQTVQDALRAALPPRREPAAFGRLLSLYLDTLVANQAFASVFLVHVHAAGPEGFRRRAASQAVFAAALAAMFGARTVRERFACEALVAAMSSLTSARLAVGDIEGLRALEGPITRLATTLLG